MPKWHVYREIRFWGGLGLVVRQKKRLRVSSQELPVRLTRWRLGMVTADSKAEAEEQAAANWGPAEE